VKLPKLGLFGRTFLLFGSATVLLALSITATFLTISEDSVTSRAEDEHDFVVSVMDDIQTKPIDINELQRWADTFYWELAYKNEKQRITTDPDFPTFDTLKANSIKIRTLRLTKHKSKFYLFKQGAKPKSWIAITSTATNFMVYPSWLVYWPILIVILIIVLSYLILKYWLSPISAAINTVKAVSSGDFNQRINKHPSNELAELTMGINKMVTDLQSMFDSKNDLLLSISHELRSPLARMKVSLAMIEGNEIAKDITKELDHDIAFMNNLIEQLLEGERLKQGHEALLIAQYYLPVLIDELTSETNIKNKVQLVGNIPEEVIDIDVGRIKFVLRNLLMNAIVHNAENTKITLTIDYSHTSIRIYIEDKGKGMSDSELTKIFEPFYCVGSVKNRSAKTTGLGLYLCKKIAQAHGGNIIVESSLDEYSKLTLVLPASPSN
jgi:signal transduction histidine kinase